MEFNIGNVKTIKAVRNTDGESFQIEVEVEGEKTKRTYHFPRAKIGMTINPIGSKEYT